MGFVCGALVPLGMLSRCCSLASRCSWSQRFISSCSANDLKMIGLLDRRSEVAAQGEVCE
jgi:hypothetical protein